MQPPASHAGQANPDPSISNAEEMAFGMSTAEASILIDE